ncbi:MAG TPA: response regulator, partial [Acidimicrobiales bacterium]
MPRPIRVLLADDTASVRMLLRGTLEASTAFEVVGEAGDGAQAVAMAAALQPDMVLLDLAMPILGGMEAIPQIRSCAPGARVVVVSGYAPDRMGSQAVEVGAAAFLEKQQRPRELVASLLQTWKSTQPQPPLELPAVERFRQAFEEAPLAMALVGFDDRVQWANAAWCRITGYGADELAALTVAELTHPEDRDEAAAGRRAVGAGELPAHRAEVRLLRPDSRTVWALIACSPVEDGLVVQLVDVTERRRLLLDLTRSNGELSSFSFLAAHELKSPIQVISGFAALLDRALGPELDPQAREFVGWIVGGAARMNALVEDLLTYCAVDSDDARSEDVELAEVLAGCQDELDPEITRRGAVVSAGPLPVVTGDPMQLAQVLRNLLANAVKFVPEGRAPEVHVSAERGAEMWTVTVTDNGIGVEDEARERIFAMFERLHPRERFKGTGIGLSICKRIVERH